MREVEEQKKRLLKACEPAAYGAASKQLSDAIRDFRRIVKRVSAQVADEADAADVRLGRKLDVEMSGLTALFDPSGEFLALYEPQGDRARAVAVFVG